MPSRDKLPKGKRQLLVLISEDLYKLLVEVAPSLYGGSRYRGALSSIVEEALRHYLNLRAHTKSTQNPSRSVRLVYQQVKDKVKGDTEAGLLPRRGPREDSRLSNS
jgi:hypothetical protein